MSRFSRAKRTREIEAADRQKVSGLSVAPILPEVAKVHPAGVVLHLLIALLFCNISLFAAPIHAAVDNSGPGILQIPSQAPMQSLRMVMPLRPAGSVTSGWRMSAAGTWTNVWAEERDYSLDYEMLESRVAIDYGFGDTFGIAIGFDNRNYFGGKMDSFIQEFHHTLGKSQNGRDLVDKDLNRVGRKGADGGQSAAGIFQNRGVSLTLTYELSQGDGVWPAVNLSAAARYGLASGELFTDNHPIDYGLSLGIGKRWLERWVTHVILTCTFFDFDRSRSLPGFPSLEFENQQFGGLLSIGYEHSQRWAFFTQYLVHEAAVENIRGLNRATHEVHLGIKMRTEELGTFEVGVIENLVNYDNSPDFGLHLGWSYRF